MVEAEVRFQSPGDAENSLLAALSDSCAGAHAGGGIFAWTNRAGITSLFDDDAFAAFLRSARFDLVVGIDTITDEGAIALLEQRQTALGGLDVRVFLHEEEGLFHPKLAWFEHRHHVELVLGSGNLTGGGLMKNWEACIVASHVEQDKDELLAVLVGWRKSWSQYLVPLSDPRVRERARRNAGSERALKRAQRGMRPVPLVALEADVLVAEFTKSSSGTGRVRQANINRENYEVFFGMRTGQRGQIRLRHVDANGRLAEEEVRSNVEVRSQNYRFELAGLPAMEPRGRMIGVFVRLEPDSFLYRVVLPDDSGYAVVSQFLDDRWTLSGRELRRVRTTAGELQEAWPEAPFWQVQLPDQA